MHFFIEQDKLPNQSTEDQYGPQIVAPAPNTSSPDSIYNITSRFHLTSEAKAFACEDAKMIVQQSIEDDSLVNIILRPISVNKEVNIDVKYYVYRGIKKNSLFGINDDDSTVNEFYQIIPLPTSPFICADVVSNFYIPRLEIPKKPTPPTPPYYAKHFGYDRVIDMLSAESNLLTDEVSIESIFEDSQSSIGVYPIDVREGDWIGTFGTTHKVGFEVLLNTNRFTVDLGYVRAIKHQIIIPSGLTDFAEKAKREEILYFIDPAAFFGAYHNLGVKTYNLISKRNYPGSLYSNVISKFATKNKVYLDIRSEKGYSYNFYENYNDGNSKNFQIRHSGVYQPVQDYQDNHWPIIIIDTALSSNNTINKLKFKLRIDDNTEPILYFSNEYFLGTKSKYVRDIEIIGTATSTDWSKEIGVQFPSVGSLNLATYIKAYYFREEHYSGTNWENEFYYDSAFCSIDIPNIGTNLIKSKSVIGVDETYIREPLHEPLINGTTDPDYNAIPKYGTGNFAFNAETGAYWDNTNVLFYSKQSYSNDKLKSGKKYIKTYDNKFEFASLDYNKNLKENWDILCREYNIGTSSMPNYKRIPQINMYKKDNGVILEKQDLMLLGLTKLELASIKSTTGFSTGHNRYLHLVADISNPQIDSDSTSIRVFKYTINLQGCEVNGVPTIIATRHNGSPIVVYSRDNQFFSTVNFSSQIPLSTGIPATNKRIEFHIYSTGYIRINDNIDLSLVMYGLNSQQIYYIYHNEVISPITNVVICHLNFLQINKMGRGSGGVSLEQGWIDTIDYTPYNSLGVSAKTSYIYANGDVITNGRKKVNGVVFSNYKIKYKKKGIKSFIVNLEAINNINPEVKFNYVETRRFYCRLEIAAAFIGALVNVGEHTDTPISTVDFNILCTGSCYKDGTSFPSLEHNNGEAIDTKYQNYVSGISNEQRLARDNVFANAMHDFGCTKILRGLSTHYSAGITVATYGGSLHNSHLHSGEISNLLGG